MEVPEWNRIDPNTGLAKNDFMTIFLKFASEMALNEIVRNLCVNRSQELESLLEAASTTSIAASLCGNIFEAYVFRIMQKYSNFPWNARVLGTGDTESPVFEFRPSCGTDLELNQFHNASEIIFFPTEIYKASRKNYAGIDGFCADGIFNMTVASKHEIIMRGDVIDLIKRGLNEGWFQMHSSGKAIGYLFFVPWNAFGSWTRAQPSKSRDRGFADLSLNLLQIAVEVPRPKSIVGKSPSFLEQSK